jgi:hypothetical protein|tara:strand:- start:3347 stop:4618 length:1272 start_codon:yes stop_codon:yes gene_type:complete
MARFHGLIGLLALTSVSALFLSSPAVSQPYPGYDGNPQFRFTNGAVGTVQALREDGTADVDYYDGSGIASANVAASADTSTATDRDTGDVARFMEQLEDIGLTNPNVCLDGDNNVASDSSRLAAACQVTRLDQCLGSTTQQDSSGNTIYVDRYPCISSAGSASSGIDIYYLSNNSNGRYCSSYDSACKAFTYGRNTYNAQWPVGVDPSADPAIRYDQVNDAWEACFLDANGEVTTEAISTTACKAFNAPRYNADGFQSSDFPSDLPPVNFPSAPPNDAQGDPLTGPVMNPGGFQGGGSGGGAGDFTDLSGGGSGGGGTGGDGTGGDGTEAEEPPNCVTDKCAVEVLGTEPIPDQEVNVGTLDYSSSVIGGGCPSNVSVEVFGQSIQVIDYGLICQYAGVIRAFVLIAATFTALGVVFGGLRGA